MTKRILHSLILLLMVSVAFSTQADAADKAGIFTVLSMGTKSCGEYVANYNENGSPKLNNSIWIAGYITAYNEYMSRKKNIASGTDPAAWDLWVFNYCSKDPLASIANATSALVNELGKRH